MTEKEKSKLYDLYFNEFYSIEQLVRHFKKKYTYLEIRTEIRKYLESKVNNKWAK